MAFEPGARGEQPADEPALEVRGRLGRHRVRREADAARAKRHVRRIVDHVPASKRVDILESKRCLSLQALDQGGEEHLLVAQMQRQVHLFLGLEVEVDGALGEAGRLGDVGDVGQFVALGEEPLGRIENGLSPGFLVVAVDRPHARTAAAGVAPEVGGANGGKELEACHGVPQVK